MHSFNHSPLGVISCPGSHSFTKEIIKHLQGLSRYHFLNKSEHLAKSYGISQEEVIRNYNLNSDLNSSHRLPLGSPDRYRTPRFEVETKFTRFANGEIKAEILNTIRERDIYIVQDVYSMDCGSYFGTDATEYSVNDHLMTLLTAIDAVKGAGPARITCVVPAYPYSRQHKKKGREGLTAALFGRILEEMGVHRILTLDIHSKDIDHTFKTLHLDSLHASYQILKQLTQIIDINSEDIVVVSPDTGAVDRNKYYANSLSRPLAILYKERDYSKVSPNGGDSNIKNIRMLGDVEGKTVFLADDMLGTGGTLIKAMEVMKEMGAKKVIIGISLPLFSADAVDRFDQAFQDELFYKMIGCNAVGLPQAVIDRQWYAVADVSRLFAQAISRLHASLSLGPLLDNNELIQNLLGRSSGHKGE